jgi:hypothetical protein
VQLALGSLLSIVPTASVGGPKTVAFWAIIVVAVAGAGASFYLSRRRRPSKEPRDRQRDHQD